MAHRGASVLWRDLEGDGHSGRSLQPIGAGAGFIGDILRVSLQYDGRNQGAPATLIAKLPTSDAKRALMSNAARFNEREIRFYRELAAESRVRTPQCYYADMDIQAAPLRPAARGHGARAGRRSGRRLLGRGGGARRAHDRRAARGVVGQRPPRLTWLDTTAGRRTSLGRAVVADNLEPRGRAIRPPLCRRSCIASASTSAPARYVRSAATRCRAPYAGARGLSAR